MDIKKSLVASTLATLMLTSGPVLAGPKSLTFEGNSETDFSYSSDDDSVKVNKRSAEIKATLVITEALKAVIKVDLAEAINEGEFDEDDLESMIEEAYIEVDANGYATILVGKHQMAFAQQYAAMAIHENDRRDAITRQDEMIGITVKLPNDTLKIVGKVVDSLEISAFETGKGDLDVASDAGVSFRATKALSDKVELAVSGLMKEQDGADEQALAVSATYKADNGWTWFAEGIWMNNSSEYGDADYLVTAGASKEVGPGTLVLQADYLENYGAEIGASYHLPVTQNITFSPEIRHNFDTDETTVGARVTMKASVTKTLNGGEGGKLPDSGAL